MITAVIAMAMIGQTKWETVHVQVGADRREALVFEGSGANRPLVLVFHGHGGSPYNASIAYRLQKEWPEAVVAYAQGMPNPSPRSGRLAPGWQRAPGDSEDRDLVFVDALVAELTNRFSIDKSRVFACGMSNGGLFTYLLFHSRPKLFRAYGSVGAGAGFWLRKSEAREPYFMVFGEADKIVSYDGFKRTRDYLLKHNKCAEKATEFAPGFERFKSEIGADVVVRVHPGGHTWPAGTTAAMVKFFKGFKPSPR